MTDSWNDLATQLAKSLADHPAMGAIDAGEVDLQVGNVELNVLFESTDADPESQRLGYAMLCDLITKRLEQGAGQVIGSMLIDGDPDPDAFVEGLVAMERPDGVFTPVIPISRYQASELQANGSTLYELADPATALIEVAASRNPITKDVAETALSELDELISRARQ